MRSQDLLAQREAHWDAVYARQDLDAVSWYQPEPTASLDLIDTLGITPEAAVLDVGGGASALTATLEGRGFSDLTVIDVSERALAACQHRLGSRSTGVNLVHHDVLTWRPQRGYDLWHDRAVLHFFVDPADRDRYVDAVTSAVGVDGRVIIGVFAENGPAQCSGLPVMRYSARQLAEVLDEQFEMVEERREDHRTPRGTVQPFQWGAFARRGSSG